MRYLGGMLGGTWLTALAGDLGDGIFDGANLVANFESLNPANTYWEKAYNVYSKVDTEAARFLDFETWWGSPVLLNADEMQWIADNLFVGNKLTSGEIRTSDGVRIDLRNIKSPIIVFCSWGDNITPPQQALGWITDLYGHEDEIVANGQTIVYTLHQTIGHLGIFVSGKVATKEHDEFASCMDMIDCHAARPLRGGDQRGRAGHRTSRSHPRPLSVPARARTLDDIRALGGNSDEDNHALRRRRPPVGDQSRPLLHTCPAAGARDGHRANGRVVAPVCIRIRLRFEIFSDKNPMMQPVKGLAEAVRADRRPVARDNPLLTLEQVASTWITTWWESFRQARDAMTEVTFLGVYGSPLLQAMVGLGIEHAPSRRGIDRDLLRETDEAKMRVELERRFEVGGLPQAALRALIYICMPQRSVDERGFAMLQAIRAMQPTNARREHGRAEGLPEGTILAGSAGRGTRSARHSQATARR